MPTWALAALWTTMLPSARLRWLVVRGARWIAGMAAERWRLERQCWRGAAILAFADTRGEDAAAADASRGLGGWIAKDVFSTLKQDVGQETFEKFIEALQKGIVGPTGKAGIKALKGNIGFTHELKIKGSSARILGNVEEWNGVKKICFQRINFKGFTLRKGHYDG